MRTGVRVQADSPAMTTTPKDIDRGTNTVAPILLNVLDAARLLGVGRTTIYELIARGKLEVVHIGRAARIPASSIDRFVDELRGR